ncbi:MAG: YjgP/YjgQ family permease [Ignavibacteria bacterium]|nr:YjgP/YjgQ family permease [Ignavibacteria bacterium]
MTILDRYIVRQFVTSFLFGLIAFVLIFLVIDMMEKLGDFLDTNAETLTIVQYYLAFSPEIIKLMTPVAMLLAALFVTGRLVSQNELAAMKSSGVSLYRIMIPFLAVALIVSFVSIYFNGWIVPYANQTKFDIERAHLRRSISSSSRYDIFFQEGRTRLVSIGFYDSNSRLASRVSIQEFSDTNLTVMTRRYDAGMMQWGEERGEDSVRTGWILLNGTYREFRDGGSSLEFFDHQAVGRLALTPTDIEKKQRKPDELDYGELKEFIANQANAGQEISRWLVDYHAKIAFPFASLIVVLFGVPFAAAKPRGGVALEFGVSVAVTFIYLAFMKTSQVFGYNGDLNPLLTAWLANILFLAAGIVNLMRVQK